MEKHPDVCQTSGCFSKKSDIGLFFQEVGADKVTLFGHCIQALHLFLELFKAWFCPKKPGVLPQVRSCNIAFLDFGVKLGDRLDLPATPDRVTRVPCSHSSFSYLVITAGAAHERPQQPRISTSTLRTTLHLHFAYDSVGVGLCRRHCPPPDIMGHSLDGLQGLVNDFFALILANMAQSAEDFVQNDFKVTPEICQEILAGTFDSLGSTPSKPRPLP